MSEDALDEELGHTAAKTKHELVKIAERELNLSIKQGLHVERAAVRQAQATALALLTQTLRSIPDNLERRLALPAAALDAIGEEIDRSLATLAETFRKLGEG